MSTVTGSKHRSSMEVVGVDDSVAFVVAEGGQIVNTADKIVAAFLVAEACLSVAEVVVNVHELNEETENSSLWDDQLAEASYVTSAAALSVECVDVLATQHLF